MIRIQRPPQPPAILITDGVTETNRLRDLHAQGVTDFSFNKDIYAHREVKTELRRMQHDKCCFCEAYVPHISSGDVEHFRPKSAIRQHDDATLEKPGYFWLAYQWKNLLFCCELCNRRHKRNLFPLVDPDKRLRTPDGDINNEFPLFINPTSEDPASYISFRDEMPFAVDGNARGRKTIRQLGLDRSDLADDRFKQLEILRLIMSVAKEHPDVQKRSQARARVLRARADSGEYAAMVRAELDRTDAGLVP